MENMMVGMLAETSVHVGAGQSSVFGDLPVAREGITSYPVIPSTGLKGSFKEQFGGDTELFGNQEKAGAVIFSEGRLLLLPVRSLTSSYKWVTCPHILERLKRDIERTFGRNVKVEKIPPITEGKALGVGTGLISLEEREFTLEGTIDDNVIGLVKTFIPNKDVQERLASQLVILSDSDFKWFAQYGLSVNARNALTDKKTSDNLWYEESLPADSVFYTIVMERTNGNMEKVKDHINEKPYIQLGGNETVGQGWFNIFLIEG